MGDTQRASHYHDTIWTNLRDWDRRLVSSDHSCNSAENIIYNSSGFLHWENLAKDKQNVVIYP